MSIPELVSEAWENRQEAVVLTTVDPQGKPNAIYATCNRLFEGCFLVADNYFSKTRENILSGSSASLLFITQEGKSFQIKGSVRLEDSGKFFENMKSWNPERLPGKAVAVIEPAVCYTGAEKLS